MALSLLDSHLFDLGLAALCSAGTIVAGQLHLVRTISGSMLVISIAYITWYMELLGSIRRAVLVFSGPAQVLYL